MNIERAVKLAIQNVIREGLTDIFPRPFEVDLLKNNLFENELQKICVTRLKSNALEGLNLRPIQHVLFPKKEPFDFRRAALIEPIDTVLTLALAILVADQVEKARPEKRRRMVFSYRFKPSKGYLFDPKFNFTAFDNHISTKTKSARTKVLVKCDIASFYDRLNIHRLEATLAGLKVDGSHVKLLNEILLFWAKRDSYGLPIGGNASRILAEAALISVDDYLISNNIIFCRFVDDYRFFAPNIETAHKWLTMFVERLFREGLTINPSKTALEDVSLRKQGDGKKKTQNADMKSDSITKQPTRLIVGYSGIIPTKFRKLSDRELSELADKNFDEALSEIQQSVIILPDKFRYLLKIMTAQKLFSKVSVFLSLLDKFPQFTPLFIDLVIKTSLEIDLVKRQEIITHFSKKLHSADQLPEYILISVIRLFGASGFESKDELMALYRSLRRNSGAFVGRSVIEALTGLCNRTDALEIREYFDRADTWEKRAITRLVELHLPEAEKRPWLKNVKLHQKPDIFASEAIDPKKPKKSKGKIRRQK